MTSIPTLREVDRDVLRRARLSPAERLAEEWPRRRESLHQFWRETMTARAGFPTDAFVEDPD